MQYYRGIATLDENLLFVREPQNPYDRNAIRVDSVANVQVGQYFPVTPALRTSIPRDVAAALAPLLDRGVLQAEGTVIGVRNSYNIPISIQLFAPTSQSSTTLQQLQLNRLDIRAGPGQAARKEVHLPPTPPPSFNNGSAYNHLLQTSVAFDPRSIRDAPEKFGLSIKDLEALPQAKQPTQVKTKMLPYQLQGLAWLLKMEHPRLPTGNDVVQFWTRRGTNWFNMATRQYYTFLT